MSRHYPLYERNHDSFVVGFKFIEKEDRYLPFCIFTLGDPRGFSQNIRPVEAVLRVNRKDVKDAECWSCTICTSLEGLVCVFGGSKERG